MTAPAPIEEFEFSRMLFVGVEWAGTFNQFGLCGMAVGGGGGGVSEGGGSSWRFLCCAGATSVPSAGC